MDIKPVSVQIFTFQFQFFHIADTGTVQADARQGWNSICEY